jgi:hypothetical protein
MAQSRTHRRAQVGSWPARALAIFGLSLSFLPGGCGGDECREGEVRCFDNVAQSCEWLENAQGLGWYSYDCDRGVCQYSKQEGYGPFCSRDKNPVATRLAVA